MTGSIHSLSYLRQSQLTTEFGLPVRSQEETCRRTSGSLDMWHKSCQDSWYDDIC
jgi:hypothetical protein